LQSYTDFDWDDLPLNAQEFEDYKGKYLDIYEKVQKEAQKEKISILDAIDFELELIYRDRINVAYIIKLLAKMKGDKTTGAAAQRKAILDLLGGDVMLRSKRELIEKFIEENLPFILDADKIEEVFEQYWQDQKVLALSKLCEEEHLDKAQFKALIDAYIYSDIEPIKDDVLKCLDNKPSALLVRTIGERILDKMKEFVDVFVNGMVG
jgi:type I restriction enzyme R subunit